MRWFKGAAGLDFTWYRSNTLNQTFIAELPASSGYSGVYVQAGNVQNSGIELTFEADKKWGDFEWNSRFTYSFNDNIIKRLANGVKNPVSGETISMSYLTKGTLGDRGSPEVRLLEGGSMGDIYIRRDWQRDDNGDIFLDERELPVIINSDYKKTGSLLPKAHSGWRNTLSYMGVTVSVLIYGRFGGNVVSNTQAIIDRYGVSEYSARKREEDIIISGVNVPAREYVNIVAAGTGQGAHYVYNATNIRLGELSIHYAIPKKWTGNFANVTIGLAGANLKMIYCKAPFDPELTPSAINTYYAGVDYFMQPSLKNYGFNVRVEF